MKKILPIALLAILGLTACNSGSKNDLETQKQIVLSDTTKVYPNNSGSDTAAVSQTTPVVAAPLVAPVNQPKTNAPVKSNSGTIVKKNTPAIVPTPAATVNTPAATAPVSTDNNTVSTAPASTTTPAVTPAEKKKGWSNSAKGAVIGGVGGAAAGAVIGKNGKGAIIGGIIGAAGGYIIGKKKDKKDTTIKH